MADFEDNCQAPNPQYQEQYQQVRNQNNQKCVAKVIKASQIQCPAIKNHTSVHYKNQIIIFGGYDSKKNHNDIYIFNENQQWIKAKSSGKMPEGRNGHTATVVDNKMYVIGGWLGSGTYASRDVYVLDLDNFNWSLINTTGEVPGPCNMHSADLIGQYIYIFRGGDGKDYLNDLHSLNTKTNVWKFIVTDKDCPPQRANHSSTVLNNKLYIFGGWNGISRLNDLYQYDVNTNKWTELKPFSPPSARAGMCMASVENKLFLFGGSGPNVTCYGDLQCYDPIKNSWLILDLQDEDQVVKARAGHSMAAIGSQIYIFGGSCGSFYFKDFFIIDTNPPPEIQIIEQSNLSVNSFFKSYFNNPKFSDIQFNVQGETFYAHKLILSKYEMFSRGFDWNEKEGQTRQIQIIDYNIKIFQTLLYFIYSGEYQPDIQQWSLEFIEQMLQISDQYLILDMKVACEKQLQNLLSKQTINSIKQIADKCNALQIRKYCDWYQMQQRLQ